MNYVCCGSASVAERPEITARRCWRFRCQACGRQFNERSAGLLNRTCLASDVIAFVVLCRLCYRLTLRDLSETLALRGIEVSYEAVRDWETTLLPAMGDALRERLSKERAGSRVPHDVERSASASCEAEAAEGGVDELVVTVTRAEEASEFAMLAAGPVGRCMALEGAVLGSTGHHTGSSSTSAGGTSLDRTHGRAQGRRVEV